MSDDDISAHDGDNTTSRRVHCPSPRHTERRGDGKVRFIVLHYTDMPDAEASLDLLSGPDGAVSCHYLIDTDGTLYDIVDEDRRAWHAGVSRWAGVEDVNSHSIGIELQYKPEEDGILPPFPDAQIARLIALIRDIRSRHDVPDANILAHSDIAPDRKEDPGAAFPWERLAKAGIGLWPDRDAVRSQEGDEPDPGELPSLLEKIGYDPAAAQSVAAFQRRFRPTRIDNRADAETTALAIRYLDRIESERNRNKQESPS